MTVRVLKEQFKKNFGSTLRVYKGVGFADDSLRLASLRAADKAGGQFSCGGNMKVGNFEKQMMDLFGIKVQVANADDTALADNSITLVAAGKK